MNGCLTLLHSSTQQFIAATPAEPIKLHAENPHYLSWRGKPTVLITSGEHYGTVLNLDFDYVRYLDELQRCGLNLTRTFGGVYCEGPGSFKIKGNTLAPKPGRLIAPWARSDTPGYANGGNKFDLTRFDPAYFARLKDFLAQADSLVALGLKTVDALHVACAIETGCDYFVTTDDLLLKRAPLRHLRRLHPNGRDPPRHRAAASP